MICYVLVIMLHWGAMRSPAHGTFRAGAPLTHDLRVAAAYVRGGDPGFSLSSAPALRPLIFSSGGLASIEHRTQLAGRAAKRPRFSRSPTTVLRIKHVRSPPHTKRAAANVFRAMRDERREQLWQKASSVNRDEASPGSRSRLGDKHIDTLMGANNLALLLFRQGKLAEAEELYREAVEGLGFRSRTHTHTHTHCGGIRCLFVRG